MWNFAVGVYFISLNPSNLQAVAINGIALNMAVIVFGAAIGDWIDRRPRLSGEYPQLAVLSANPSVYLSSSHSSLRSKSISHLNGSTSRRRSLFSICFVILLDVYHSGYVRLMDFSRARLLSSSMSHWNRYASHLGESSIESVHLKRLGRGTVRFRSIEFS